MKTVADLNKIYQELWQRPPTDEELSRIYRVKNALGIETTDAFFSVLLAHQFYDDRFHEGREKLRQEIDAVVTSGRAVAQSKLDEVAAQTVATIQDRVSEGVKAAAGTAIADVGATKRSISLAAVLALVIVSLFLGGAIQSALDAPRAATGVMDSLLFAFIDYMSRSGAGYFYISLALGVLLLHDMRHRSIRSFGGFIVSMVLIAFGLWPLLSAVASVIR